MLKRHEILSFNEMVSCLFVGKGLMRGGSATSPISSLREINLHSPYFAAYSSFSPFSILGGVKTGGLRKEVCDVSTYGPRKRGQ